MDFEEEISKEVEPQHLNGEDAASVTNENGGTPVQASRYTFHCQQSAIILVSHSVIVITTVQCLLCHTSYQISRCTSYMALQCSLGRLRV